MHRVLAAMITLLLLLLAVWTLRTHWPIATLLVLLAVAVQVAWRLGRRKEIHKRAQFLHRYPEVEQDMTAMAISRVWYEACGQPHSKTSVLEPISVILTTAKLPDSPGLLFVCLGPRNLPEVGELQFEPRAFSTTDLLWRRIWLIPSLSVFSAANSWSCFVSRIWIPCAVSLLVAVVMPAAWLWKAGLRPNFVRLAPGLIQLVTFPLGRGKPVIRSYPADSSTVVVVSPGRFPTFAFVRGGERDYLATEGSATAGTRCKPSGRPCCPRPPPRHSAMKNCRDSRPRTATTPRRFSRPELRVSLDLYYT